MLHQVCIRRYTWSRTLWIRTPHGTTGGFKRTTEDSKEQLEDLQSKLEDLQSKLKAAKEKQNKLLWLVRRGINPQEIRNAIKAATEEGAALEAQVEKARQSGGDDGGDKGRQVR